MNSAVNSTLNLSDTSFNTLVAPNNKFFENFAYIKASELYEDAVKNGDDSVHVLTRLGDCYYNNSNSEKAAIF